MADQETTVAELREIVGRFVEERDWRQFHAPKNLSMSLAIEAAELMEHFQWLTPEETQAVAGDAGKLHDVGEELADVLAYSLAMANALNIDVADALRRKMIRNAEKYPVEKR
jgi:NTP pyrophosphatase (non-canonical NTP hydrolase)